MDLFEVPNDQKEFLSDGSIVINLKSNSKYKITINKNIIKVEQFGALNKINRGLVGEKLYNLDTVTGTQLKEPGMTTGYFVIQTPGSRDVRGGVQKAVKDEDSILFTKKEADLVHQIKEYIEYYLINGQAPPREETIFIANETPIPPSSNHSEPPKKEEKERKGCLYYLKIAGIAFLAIILLAVVFSLFGGGGSDTSDTGQTTDQSAQEQTQESQDTSQSNTGNLDVEELIRKANTYYAETGAYVTGIAELTNAEDYEETRQKVMTQVSDLQSRVQADLNSIPEETTDSGLQLARQALDIDNNLCMALYATLATNDPSGADLIKQYAEQYNSLKPQLDQYTNN